MPFRHEWKHEINLSDMIGLRHRLQAVATLDPHAVDGKYEIRSLYFDNFMDKTLREKLGVQAVSAPVGYEPRLFNTSTVHSIDIVMDDWDSFIENCRDETYETCAVIIDGDAYKNVAIRAKGNTSLSQVDSYGNNRYSFKIEFDHYDNSNSYYGLDKLCLHYCKWRRLGFIFCGGSC